MQYLYLSAQFARTIKRRILPELEYRLDRFSAVALLGPRQAGKTTLALELARTRPSLYLDLESEADLARLTEPELYMERHQDKLVILDEVHRRPDLFPALRSLIDRARRSGQGSGRSLLLGSASLELLKHSGESLAGRISYLELAPFDVLEVAAKDLVARDRLWLRGGFPDSLLAPDDETSFRWRHDFVRTYQERELPFFDARLPAWHKNPGKRLAKRPRLYYRDSGLVHALLGLTRLDDLLAHPVAGKSWEGFVTEQLLVVGGERATGYHYRSAGGAEVDLVLELAGGEVWQIEIKRSPNPKPSRGFLAAAEVLRPDRKWVVYPGEERFPLEEDTEAISLAELAALLA